MRYELAAAPRAEVEALARELGVSSVLAQLLLQRGLCEPSAARRFLDPRLSQLSSPEAMADRDAAADRLARAVRAREPITVFGDYDVDGTTSAAILGGILEQLGGRVAVLVANRFGGGYGLSDEALGRVLETRPSLLLTCDCGSSDHARIDRARAAGIDVIVVDHHLVPDEPLPALAFLNPHRPDCGFAYKGLCSAGLALSLGAAVRALLGASLDLRGWLDLVALGTIADVAPLHGDNRALVRAGLLRLSSPEARPGVVALREIARLRAGSGLGAIDVAFRMTPRLNAAGRLGDQSITLALLRARNPTEARLLGARIEQLNQERKEVEARVTREALAQVETIYGPTPAVGVVVAAEGWHRGVVGITAARLCDAFGVPSAVIALEGGSGHGSVRAPQGVSAHAAVTACADTLERFGGHAAACGLSVRAERVETLRAAFADATRPLLASSPGAPAPRVDVVVGEGGLELPGAAELMQLEPLGEGNPEPVFLLEDVQVCESRVVGDGHLKLRVRSASRELSAFGLGMGDRAPERGARLRLLGALRPDSWVGGDAVELRISAFERHD